MLILFTLAISFFLDGFVSTLVPFTMNNLFLLTAFFAIVSLVVLYPYYNHNDKQFLLSCFIIGLLYDIVYTDTLLLNATLFLLVGLFIKLINQIFTNSILNVGIISFIVLIVYHLLTYLFLKIVGYGDINSIFLVHIILKSFLLNVGYSTILYFVLDRVSDKYKIKRIN